MRWREFTQATISFLLFLLAIGIFVILNLDVNFVTTFIMAIFTLTISIFFFIESNKIMSVISDKMTRVEGKVEGMEKVFDKKVTKDLRISPSYNKGGGRYLRRASINTREKDGK